MTFSSSFLSSYYLLWIGPSGLFEFIIRDILTKYIFQRLLDYPVIEIIKASGIFLLKKNPERKE
jgi:hypothetical protein